MKHRPLISFDWALKKLLRNQANFAILEGFLSTLLKKSIVVVSILESESNADNDNQKINRVDLLVENDEKERIIIELQYNDEYDFFQRMLFATSKHIVNNFDRGKNYGTIKKVYSINLIYFDLGQGSDYVYHGKSEFRGIHQNDILGLSDNQKTMFHQENVYQIYPEYYVIKINNFNDIATDNLDEWIYYFKNDDLKDDFKAQGLAEVRDYLLLSKLSEAERAVYDKYIDEVVSAQTMIFTAQMKGIAEGRAEGIAEGERKKAIETAKKLKNKAFSSEDIADITGLSVLDINKL
jgi:predicted transposase/invertase (TIGR01784 family)